MTQHLDTGALSKIVATTKSLIFVRSIPGQLVDPTRPVASIDGVREADAEQALADIKASFSVEDTRSFDQDPRFGASVLAEIASQALSPAINDPGSAIDVIARSTSIPSLISGTDGRKGCFRVSCTNDRPQKH